MENQETEEKEKVAKIAEMVRSDEPIDDDSEVLALSDSDTEAKSLASDSEEEKDKTELISAAFNVST